MTLGTRSRPLAGATLALLLMALAMLTGCAGSDNDGKPVTLDVTIQDWTGWSRTQPEPDQRTATLAVGEEFTVRMLGDEVTITLTSIDDDEIVLATSQDLAPASADGGSDHNDLSSEFTLDRGGSVAFTTPSLDGGTTVTVTEA